MSQSINQLIYQSINQSASPSINQSINQSINHHRHHVLSKIALPHSSSETQGLFFLPSPFSPPPPPLFCARPSFPGSSRMPSRYCWRLNQPVCPRTDQQGEQRPEGNLPCRRAEEAAGAAAAVCRSHKERGNSPFLSPCYPSVQSISLAVSRSDHLILHSFIYLYLFTYLRIHSVIVESHGTGK